MGDNSKIEWCDASWNVVTGCTKVSPGCDFCYAERVTNRFAGPGAFDKIVIHEDRLGLPLRWRRPRKIFVNSMSDVFHDDVSDDLIARMFAVMAATPRHTFQVLTKRHGRMRALLSDDTWAMSMLAYAKIVYGEQSADRWPLPNVWIGVSVEDQKWADVRIPVLLDTPAAVRFLSCEPLLGPLNLRPWLADPPWIDGDVWPPSNARERSFDWVIVGGESGPQSRPMHPDWVRRIRDDVLATRPAHPLHRDGTPFVALHFKQWGEWAPSERFRATHLLNVNGSLTTVAAATSTQSYGAGPPTEQDLIDRGHPGWIRVRKIGKKYAGRDLDGRTWDEWPVAATSTAASV